jgi:hypothetical protein
MAAQPVRFWRRDSLTEDAPNRVLGRPVIEVDEIPSTLAPIPMRPKSGTSIPASTTSAPVKPFALTGEPATMTSTATRSNSVSLTESPAVRPSMRLSRLRNVKR